MDKIDSLSSLQIKYCRILCIFFMIAVHLPPTLAGQDAVPASVLVAVAVMADVLGRASVSALSFISGFLVYFSLQRKHWLSLLGGRVTSLLVPMAFWNFALIAVGYLLLLATGEEIYAIEGLHGLSVPQVLFSRILALDYGGASDSLNFIRDIFVCMLFAPLLIAAIRRLSWLVVIALLVFDQTISFQPVVYRGLILVFFAAGITYAHEFRRLDRMSWLGWPSVFLLCLVIALEIATRFVPGLDYRPPMYGLLKRLIVSVAVVHAALLLARSALPQKFISRIDRSTFFIFLGHNVFFILAWGAWRLCLGPSLEFPYLVFYFGAPSAWILLALALAPLIDRLPGPLQTLVQGKVASKRGSTPAVTTVA